MSSTFEQFKLNITRALEEYSLVDNEYIELLKYMNNKSTEELDSDKITAIDEVIEDLEAAQIRNRLRLINEVHNAVDMISMMNI